MMMMHVWQRRRRSSSCSPTRVLGPSTRPSAMWQCRSWSTRVSGSSCLTFTPWSSEPTPRATTSSVTSLPLSGCSSSEINLLNVLWRRGDASRSAGFILAVAYRGAEKPRAVPVRRWDHERLEGRSPQRRHRGRAAESGGSQPHHLSGQRSSTSLAFKTPKPETCFFAIQYCIMWYRRSTVILLFELLEDVWALIHEASSVLTECLGGPDTRHKSPQLRPGLSRTEDRGQYRFGPGRRDGSREECKEPSLSDWKDHL